MKHQLKSYHTKAYRKKNMKTNAKKRCYSLWSTVTIDFATKLL